MKTNRRIRVAFIAIGAVCVAMLMTCSPLGIRDTITALATPDPVWVSLNTDGYNAGVADQSPGAQFGYAVDISDNYAVVGAPYSPEGGTNRGAAYVFAKQSNGSWQYQKKLLSPTINDNRFFGGAVTLTDSFIAISSTGTGVNIVEIFQKNGSTWDYLASVNIASGNKVYSIKMNGNYLIAADYSSGRVRFFHYTGGTWVMEWPIDGSISDRYGYSVSIYGNYAVVGADYFSSTISHGGIVYLYERSGTNWVQVSTFEPATATANSRYGRSTSISDNYFVVGTRVSTTAYLYKLIGTSWQYETSNSVSGVVTTDEYAWSVATTGQSAIIGTYMINSGQGVAYTYWKRSGIWKNTDTLSYANANANDNYGFAVAAYGHSLVIGAPLDDNSIGTDAGTVFFYQY